MNPLAILGIVAAAGAGLAIAGRKRNAAETWLNTFWSRVGAGEDAESVIQAMLGSDNTLPSNFMSRRARCIVDRGRPGRDIEMDDPYFNPDTQQWEYDPHWGKDIGAPLGTNVRAAKTGIITYAENRIVGFGRMIMLSHLDEPNRSTLYAHLDGFNVGLGQLVAGDDVIGFVGRTCWPEGQAAPAWCRAMTYVHLHFEVHNSRIPVLNNALRNSESQAARGQAEVSEPSEWLASQGIAVVGELA